MEQTQTNPKDFPRRLTAEAVGTAFLLAAVVGSGIMGERLAGGNVAVALLANTVSTGAALTVLILTFGPISGAHFNPAVTVAEGYLGNLPWREVPGYLAVQILVWCLTNTVMKMRGHFGRRQGAMTSSGVHHARKSNAADGQKDPQIRNRICETPH